MGRAPSILYADLPHEASACIGWDGHYMVLEVLKVAVFGGANSSLGP